MTMESMENLDGQDVIGQEQQDLDSQQGIQAAAAQPITEEQVRQIVQQQTELIQRQLSGIQGLTDRALDAHRRDWTTDIERRFAEAQAGAGRQQFLNSLEEDEREKYQQMLSVMDAERRASAPAPLLDPEPMEMGPDPVTAPEQARRYVEMNGLQRNNPNIDYAVLNDPALTGPQREAVFVGIVADAVRKQAVAGVTRQPAQPPAGTAQHPPVDVGPGIHSEASLRSQDDLRSAYLEDRIPLDDYRTRMAALGITV
jgi:hypothetical protein